MKRILCGAAFIVIVTGTFAQAPATNSPPAGPTDLPALRPAPRNAVAKSDNVNVRAKAAVTGEIITRLKKGEPVVILDDIAVKKPKTDEPSHWLKIAFPSNTPVWINASFVDPTNKNVRVKKLNVRAGPGENYSVIGLMTRDDVVKEIRQKGAWMEIQAPTNAFAFVAADLLVASEEPAPIAVVQQPAPVAVVPSPAPVVAPPLETVTNTPETKTVAPVAPDKTTIAPPAKAEPADVAANPPPILPPAAAIVTNAPPSENVPPIRQSEIGNRQSPEPPAADRPLLTQKRVVSREGTVRRAYSLAAPTGFALENADTGLMMDYLFPINSRITLKQFLGYRVIVSGQEGMDKRWPATPVLMVETIEFP